MLNIYLGNPPWEYIHNTRVYFDNSYEDEWITSDFAKKVIKDIDNSDVLGSNCIQSPVLGQIPPTKIAGGTKTLLLLKNDDTHRYNISTCGDNCAKWILEIAKEKDITVRLGHIMHFDDSEPFRIKIINNNKICTNMIDFIDIAVDFV